MEVAVSDLPAPRVFRFGAFELDARAGELRQGERRQYLPDPPLQLLIALVERGDQLVTRDELHQRLWASDTFVDFEHGLNAAVKRLRDVLGDSAEEPRFIETIPRRGYRLKIPVSVGPSQIDARHAGEPLQSGPGSQSPMFYVYLSQTKLAMLWPQLPEPSAVAISKRLGLDATSADPPVRMAILTGYLKEQRWCGTVECPQ